MEANVAAAIVPIYRCRPLNSRELSCRLSTSRWATILQFLESTIYFYNFFIKIILFEKTSQFVSVVSQSDITCENLNYLRNNEANVDLLPLTNE